MLGSLTVLLVMMSTVSPFWSFEFSGTSFPLTFAPMHLWPTSVCMR